MMNTKEVLQKFEEVAEQYIRELEGLRLEQLTYKPSETVWSIGQMYMHLIQSAIYMQLRNLEACRTANNANIGGGEKNAQGVAVFSQGSFPPIKIQVPPSKEYTPQQPESKEQLVNGIRQVIQQMREIEPTIASIPADSTTLHPAFGALNATEWFALVEMHYRHHLRQLAELKEILAEN